MRPTIVFVVLLSVFVGDVVCQTSICSSGLQTVPPANKLSPSGGIDRFSFLFFPPWNASNFVFEVGLGGWMDIDRSPNNFLLSMEGCSQFSGVNGSLACRKSIFTACDYMHFQVNHTLLYSRQCMAVISSPPNEKIFLSPSKDCSSKFNAWIYITEGERLEHQLLSGFDIDPHRTANMSLLFDNSDNSLSVGDTPNEVTAIFPVDKDDYNSDTLYLRRFPVAWKTFNISLTGCVRVPEYYPSFTVDESYLTLPLHDQFLLPGKLCILKIVPVSKDALVIPLPYRQRQKWGIMDSVVHTAKGRTYVEALWRVHSSIESITLSLPPGTVRDPVRGTVIDYITTSFVLTRDVDFPESNLYHVLGFEFSSSILAEDDDFDARISGCVTEPLVIRYNYHYDEDELYFKFRAAMFSWTRCEVTITASNSRYPLNFMGYGEFRLRELKLEKNLRGAYSYPDVALGTSEILTLPPQEGRVFVKSIETESVDMSITDPGSPINEVSVSFRPSFALPTVQGLSVEIRYEVNVASNAIFMFEMYREFNISLSGCVSTPISSLGYPANDDPWDHLSYGDEQEFLITPMQHLRFRVDQPIALPMEMCRLDITPITGGLFAPSLSYIHVCSIPQCDVEKEGSLCQDCSSGGGVRCSSWKQIRPRASLPFVQHIDVDTKGPDFVKVEWNTVIPEGSPPLVNQVMYLLLHEVGSSDVPPFLGSIVNRTYMSPTLREYEVTGLKAGKGYNFLVIPYNRWGYRPNSWIQTGMITTNPPTSPLAPTSVKFPAEGFGGSELMITWKLPFDGGSPVVHYLLRYSSRGEESQIIHVPGTVHPPAAVVKNLISNTVYTFQVCGVNEEGRGQWSQPKTYPICNLVSVGFEGGDYHEFTDMSKTQFVVPNITTTSYSSYLKVTWMSNIEPRFPFAGGGETYNGRVLRVITGLMLKGVNYTVTAKMCTKCSPVSCMTRNVTISTPTVKLVSSISGSENRFIPSGINLVLNGCTSFNPNTKRSSELNHEWKCSRSLNLSSPCPMDLRRVVMNTNDDNNCTMKFPRSTMRGIPHGWYYFSLQVNQEGYVSSVPDIVRVKVVSHDTPMVTIEQVEPSTFGKIGREARLVLHAIANVKCHFEWSGSWSNDNESSHELNLQALSKSRTNSPYIIIPGGLLISGRSYTFEVKTVTNIIGTAQMDVVVVSPPFGGSLSVTPVVEGQSVAFNSPFTLEAAGWMTSFSGILKYSFFVITRRGNIVREIPLCNNWITENVLVSTLPSPFPRQNVSVTVRVRVMDEYGGMRSDIQSVYVSPVVSSVDQCVDMAGDEANELENALNSDDLDGVTNNFRSLQMMLADTRTSEVSGNDRQRLIEVRNRVITLGLRSVEKFSNDMNGDVSRVFVGSMKAAVEDVEGQSDEMRDNALMTVRKIMEVISVQPDQETLDDAVGVVDSVVEGSTSSGSMNGTSISTTVGAVARSSVSRFAPDVESSAIPGKFVSVSAMKLSGGNIDVTSLNGSFTSSVASSMLTISSMLSDNITSESLLSFVSYSRNIHPERNLNYGMSSVSVSISVRCGEETVNISGLSTTPMKFRVAVVSGGADHHCSYWDDTVGRWRQNGVLMIEENDEYIVCSTSHLTEFGVVDYSSGGGDDGGDDDSNTALIVIISVVSVVIVGLIVGLCILRRKRRLPRDLMDEREFRVNSFYSFGSGEGRV